MWKEQKRGCDIKGIETKGHRRQTVFRQFYDHAQHFDWRPDLVFFFPWISLSSLWLVVGDNDSLVTPFFSKIMAE